MTGGADEEEKEVVKQLRQELTMLHDGEQELNGFLEVNFRLVHGLR